VPGKFPFTKGESGKFPFTKEGVWKVPLYKGEAEKSPFCKGGFRGIFSRLFIIRVSTTTLSPLGAF